MVMFELDSHIPENATSCVARVVTDVRQALANKLNLSSFQKINASIHGPEIPPPFNRAMVAHVGAVVFLWWSNAHTECSQSFLIRSKGLIAQSQAFGGPGLNLVISDLRRLLDGEVIHKTNTGQNTFPVDMIGTGYDIVGEMSKPQTPDLPLPGGLEVAEPRKTQRRSRFRRNREVKPKPVKKQKSRTSPDANPVRLNSLEHKMVQFIKGLPEARRRAILEQFREYRERQKP